MKILGLIPARGGSKRLPGKNMMTLGGLPLVGHAINHAVDSGMFAEIVVSSDDPVTLAFAQSQGVSALTRPPALSRGDQPMQLSVVRHALDSKWQSLAFDAVMLLQPTSPFRTAADIVEAARILEKMNCDSVVSVTDLGDLEAFRVGHAGRIRDEKGLVVANGAIYAITTAALERGENWYSGVCYAYVMPKDASLDIDTARDLEMARAIMADQGCPS